MKSILQMFRRGFPGPIHCNALNIVAPPSMMAFLCAFIAVTFVSIDHHCQLTCGLRVQCGQAGASMKKRSVCACKGRLPARGKVSVSSWEALECAVPCWVWHRASLSPSGKPSLTKVDNVLSWSNLLTEEKQRNESPRAFCCKATYRPPDSRTLGEPCGPCGH